MATSPPTELRVLTITQFELSQKDGLWYWHTEAANSEVVGDGGEGYGELRKAVTGFLTQQGYSPTDDPQQYSKLYKVSDIEYHMRKYVYGAPDPFDPMQVLALAQVGWQPEGAEEAYAVEG
ncbi:hypothetical protein SEA_NOSHOW_25 [Mycobacterium phage NoShow]|nr:hypothetical protein SEA_NOSHOW_25 [Mycobacterium phage NoShow]